MTNSDEALRLSYSSISAYEQCPLLYKYRYVDRLEFEPRPALSFGESLHRALEWFYSAKTPHAPDIASLLRKLDEVWVPEGYAGAEEEHRYREHAKEVLTTFHHSNSGAFRLPASVEQRFELDLEGFKLTGRIDRVDRHADGSYEIIDYKTNRKLPRRERLASDLQLPIYQFAAEQVWGIPARKLTFYYLLPNQRFSTGPWRKERIDSMLERLNGLADSIRGGHFAPTPNHLCPWCDFIAHCPLDPEAEKGLAKLVDRYADLEKRRLCLEGMLKGLACELEEAWPEGEDTVHSRKNALRRCGGEEGPYFSLEA